MLGRIIREAREGSRLERGPFARLIELEEARLEQIESGRAELLPAEADRCARLLGLRVRDLLAGEAPHAPMALLLRSTFDEGRRSDERSGFLDELATTGVHKTLGAFLRVVRDFAELEERLERPAPLPLPRSVSSPPPGVHQAEHQARDVRASLGLGIEPITSMRKLLSERLDIPLFFVSAEDEPEYEEEEMHPSVDGATARAPRRAMLVNLTSSWWRTRMTLAHELGHLLFEHAQEALFSPRRHVFRKPETGWKWRLFNGFENIEVHADAFAACFLAPAEGVQRCISGHEPASESAIAAVGTRFGVGRTVAINRLQDVFNLAPRIRREMESRTMFPRYEADFPDDKVEHGIGLRSGALIPLVVEALRTGKIGKARAWEYLGLPLTEPAAMLPRELRQPPIGRESQLVAAAQRYLAEHHPDRPLHAVRIRREGAQWLIEVQEGGIGERDLADAGRLFLGEDGRVTDQVRAKDGPA